MLVVRRFAASMHDLPRWWWADDPVKTHAMNALNLIFPDGERFFIRSIRHYESRLDADLRTEARRFYGQEGQHGAAHAAPIEAMERQGLEVQSWLDRYRRIVFGRAEPWMPPIVRLSVTVALEHFTASFAQWSLTDRFLDDAHPAMRDLYHWHAAEEIEHRAVAWDVFHAVGGNWPLRILGMLIAATLFLGCWRSAMKHLYRQEPTVDKARVKATQRAFQARWGMSRHRLMRLAVLDYLRPSFHPRDAADDALAEAAIAEVEDRFRAEAKRSA